MGWQPKSDASRTGDNAAAGLGALLREARVAAGLEIGALAVELRMRKSQIEAIEEGRFEALPGPGYAVGFVRSYANAIGLDPDDVVSRYKQATGAETPQTHLMPPAPVEPAGLPTGPILVTAVLLAAVVYGGWYSLSRRPPINETEAPAQMPPESPANQAEGSPVQPMNAPGTAPGGGTTPPSTDNPGASTTVPGPQPMPAPSTAAAPPAAVTSDPEQQEAASDEPEEAPPPTPIEVAPQAGPATTPRIVVRASADSWVEVRGPDGRRLLSRVMRLGESYAVPPLSGATLMTGNAGGIELLVDGKPAPPLGLPGAVRRDVVLDPDRLREGAAPQ